MAHLNDFVKKGVSKQTAKASASPEPVDGKYSSVAQLTNEIGGKGGQAFSQTLGKLAPAAVGFGSLQAGGKMLANLFEDEIGR